MSEKITFATAADRSRALSNDTINSIVEDNLLSSSGDKVYFVKSYLDKVPKDNSDVQFWDDVEQQSLYHHQLADLISRRVKLVGVEAYSGEKQDVFRHKLDKYRDTLLHGSDTVAQYLRDAQSGDASAFPSREATYKGLTMQRTGGSSVNFLSGESAGGVECNVYIQSEIAGTFVHITSDRYIQLKAEGRKPKLDKRIYLNPKSTEMVGIFEQVLQLSEDKDIPMKGKILDKSVEPLFATTDTGDVRGDGIVLYVDDVHADALLDVVKQVYSSEREAFLGRRVSKVPMPIAPGVAIGDEPEGGTGESLTSHRSDLIEGAAKKTREALRNGETEPVPRVFRGFLRADAYAAGVNPDNLAFNKK